MKKLKQRRKNDVEFKNKLFRHHKSKFTLILRNFSLTCMGVLIVLGGIAIPTYISISSNLNVATEASEEPTKEPDSALDENNDVEKDTDSDKQGDNND